MSTELAWFKSSYSGGEGGNCVEVAVSWFKSSYSGSEGDNCVEVAVHPEAIHIRDSKDKGIRPLAVTPTAWAAFTALAAGTSLDG
ncbi:DUF397 domain-containing protein [Streptomyces colonosanans]|uniref:DUF397 domain-containing protein n=1 Tax=Streptomyces colonosanans TaxID=1428652 RepID=A0A1S2P0R0_9ACTN|nr:DUF397 domain-containing protein [Streptomyces colonosanans]OIJ87241.1 DUF397 domain-containing protein [Streptomyces colonosanans]